MIFEGKKIEKIDFDSCAYPDQLKNISNPPKQLFCCGNADLLYEDSVAVVGSRKFTMYGKNVAGMLGNTLAKAGIVVVSGLANGIDAFSHQGMLEAGGKGIGVLGSGINKMGPKKNYGLMLDVIKNDGLIVSEYEPDLPASVYTFPERNRIISGLSKKVVVVEANFDSGSLITAQFANEQGREIYAVPGNINSQFSIGSNLLIRDGATPLIVFGDLIRDMGSEVSQKYSPRVDCGEDEMEIINALLKENGSTADKISKNINRMVSETNAILTIMEIKGIIESSAGRYYLVQNNI